MAETVTDETMMAEMMMNLCPHSAPSDSAPSAAAMPASIAKLPRDPKTKLPVPFFVEWIQELPDFRIVDGRKLAAAVKERRCWICGERLGTVAAFIIGPMCAVNRVSAEPPSHHDCASYAARACPFLSQPSMRRNEKNLPEGYADGPGIPIRRNPGVSLVWVTGRYSPFRTEGGWMFDVGEPALVEFLREGRPATYAEVMASVESGLPLLAASAEADGKEAVRVLSQMTHEAKALIKAQFQELEAHCG